jgi:hypothetical protein
VFDIGGQTMDALTKREPIDRPRYAWIAVAMQLPVGLLAVPVGYEMIVNPGGSALGMPQAWIDATPFGSWLVPGIFLLLVNGIGQLLAAGLIIARHWLAPWLTGALGIGLTIWIAVQVVLMPFHPLQPTLFVVGLIEGFIALFWLRRLGRVGGSTAYA